MTKLKLLIAVLLIIEITFNACDQADNEIKENSLPVTIKKEYANKYFQEYSFTIYSNNWKIVNSKVCFVDLPIDSITETTIKEGLLMLYLKEKNEYTALPFNYYQVRKILSFQPSFEPGHAYINVYGNFIINVSPRYEFKLVIVSPECFKKSKNLDWRDLEKVRALMKIQSTI